MAVRVYKWPDNGNKTRGKGNLLSMLWSVRVPKKVFNETYKRTKIPGIVILRRRSF